MAATAVPPQPPNTPLAGRVAIVTGASRGIGREIALHLHSLGAKLILNYVSASSSESANLLASDLNTIAVQADISTATGVTSLFDAAEKHFNTTAHILVNCAGILDPKYPTLANTALEDFESTFNINTKGSFLCLREASNRLIRGGGGRIVFITSSIVASTPPGYGAYGASKAAVETMAKIAAKELKGTGITVNCVAPGAVETDMFYAGKSEVMIQRAVDACPLGRLGRVGDVAPIVGFLVTDAGEWVNGQVIRVNGGAV